MSFAHVNEKRRKPRMHFHYVGRFPMPQEEGSAYRERHVDCYRQSGDSPHTRRPRARCVELARANGCVAEFYGSPGRVR